MKKIFVITFLFVCFYGNSQSMQLFYEKQPVAHEDTLYIIVSGTISTCDLDIINTSGNMIKLMVKRTVISLLQNAENMFCLGECFAPETDKTTTPFDFFSGDTLSRDTKEYDYFYTSYKTYGEKGISIIKYTFYDNNNPSDETSVIFKFDSESTGISDIRGEKTSINVYPNPASGVVTVEHHLNNQTGNANLLVSNAMGMVLKSISINSSGKMQVDISDLASGIYFYSIEENGNKSVAKKLIIK